MIQFTEKFINENGLDDKYSDCLLGYSMIDGSPYLVYSKKFLFMQIENEIQDELVERNIYILGKKLFSYKEKNYKYTNEDIFQRLNKLFEENKKKKLIFLEDIQKDTLTNIEDKY